MVQRTGRRARRGVRRAAWLVPVGVALGLAGACSQLQGSLGDDCLKGPDCLSGICSQFHCVAAPPLLEGPLASDASAPVTDGGDGGLESEGSPSDDATIESAAPVPEASSPDATGSPSDGAADAVDETPPDAAPGDAPSDAVDTHPSDAADTHEEAGEAG
jgi:hypothetical protein